MCSARTLDVEFARFGCLFGCLPVLPRDDVSRVPARPVVLRRGWFVLAVMLFRLTQQFCQSCDVQIAKSSSRQPGGNFLKQPTVAVRVVERSKGKVAPMTGIGP